MTTEKDLIPETAEKLYIIIVGAVAAGKTTLAMNLAKALKNCFYYDKDDLGPVSEAAFKGAGRKRYDRHGSFFKRYLRDPEYDASEKLTLKGLCFSNAVVYNAPYTSEINTEAKGGASERLQRIQEGVHARGGKMILVFVECDRKTVKQHLIKRGKEDPEAYKRDRYIYKSINRFISTQNLQAPPQGAIRHTDALFTFDARKPEESFRSLLSCMNINCGAAYDPEIGKKPTRAER